MRITNKISYENYDKFIEKIHKKYNPEIALPEKQAFSPLSAYSILKKI